MKKLLLTMIFLLTVTAVPAQADPRNGFAADNARGEQRGRLTASEAAARVQAREGGKILSVDPVRGGEAYRVKILNRRGQVRVVTVDASR